MKRTLRMILLCLITLMVLFLLSACGQLETTTPEAFSAYMEENGFIMSDADETDAPQLTVYTASQPEEKYSVRFIVTIDNDYAKYNVWDQIKGLGFLEKNETEIKERKRAGRFWVKYRFTYGERYCAATRINNTILIVDAPKEYKNEILAFFDMLGY